MKDATRRCSLYALHSNESALLNSISHSHNHQSTFLSFLTLRSFLVVVAVVVNVVFTNKTHQHLTQATSFTFRFKQAQNVSFTDGSLDVTDNAAALIVEQFNTDLSNTTTRTSTAEALGNTSVFNFVSFLLLGREGKGGGDKSGQKQTEM